MTIKTCVNCPGATDHDTANCPLRATIDVANNRFEVPVTGWVHPEQAEGAQGEREAFEAFMRKRGEAEFLQRSKHDPEKYDDYDTQHAWRAWEARAALAQPSPAPELEPLIPDNIPRFVLAEGRMSKSGSGTWMRDSWLHLIQDQHDRIVGALRAEVQRWHEASDEAMQLNIKSRKELRTAIRERDAALEKVAEMEGQSGIEFVYDSDELVAVPRGLLGAACHAIDKKRYAPRTIAKLREYARGLPTPVAQAGQVPEVISALREACEYLDENHLNQIGSGSKLHCLMRNAFAAAPQPVAKEGGSDE